MKSQALKLDEFKYTLWERFWDLKPLSILEDWTFKVRKIIDWIPVLWNDFDFENTHILKILDHKLKRVQKVMREDPYHVDEKTGKLSGPGLAREIQEARDCIARIIESEYCKNEHRKHDQKHGELKFDFDSKESKTPASYGKDGKPLTYPLIFINGGRAASRSLLKIYKLEDKRKQDDYNKLYKILNQKMQGWWN